ncbi:MAG: alpha/beta hydrolase [Pirellulales bacterium]|nr:alpha/beta hydrolase [Pirellulales bacterium]
MIANALIFYPSKYPAGDWKPWGLEFEDAWFAAADGTALHGWYVPCEDARATILIAHGNAGNLSDRVDMLRTLHRLRATAMIFDYRGYGRSAGRPTVAGILADGRAARAWLAQRENLLPRKLVLLGESLGGAVMIDLAARDGARGVILENAFTSLADVAAYHFPWLPVKLLLRGQLDSLAKIGNYRGPLLQRHGDADQIVPFALAEQLFAAAHEPKRLVVEPGGDHNEPPTRQYLSALDEFLDSLP